MSFCAKSSVVGPINWYIENTSGINSLRYDSHMQKKVIHEELMTSQQRQQSPHSWVEKPDTAWLERILRVLLESHFLLG